MFIAAVIPLTVQTAPASKTARFFGRQTHALFLDLVARADAALADALHEPRSDKPFTVSNLIRAESQFTQRASQTARPFERASASPRVGERFVWRVTAFDARLSETLKEKVLPRLPRQVRVGAAQFEVGAPITERAQHSWAGTSDAGQLWQKWFHETPPPDKQFALEFVSPTAYRHIHRNMLVPLPEGIFTRYLAAWNAHGAPALEQDLLEQIARGVTIQRYALQTTSVDFGDFREAGWLGICHYTIHSEEIALRRVAHLLADFAFYCGTGYKTTQGMGQTRRMA